MPAVPSAVFNKRDRKHHLGEAILHVFSMRDNWSYRASLRRVEITDDRAKRPTMGGSMEPPFLLS